MLARQRTSRDGCGPKQVSECRFAQVNGVPSFHGHGMMGAELGGGASRKLEQVGRRSSLGSRAEDLEPRPVSAWCVGIAYQCGPRAVDVAFCGGGGDLEPKPARVQGRPSCERLCMLAPGSGACKQGIERGQGVRHVARVTEKYSLEEDCVPTSDVVGAVNPPELHGDEVCFAMGFRVPTSCPEGLGEVGARTEHARVEGVKHQAQETHATGEERKVISPCVRTRTSHRVRP